MSGISNSGAHAALPFTRNPFENARPEFAVDDRPPRNPDHLRGQQLINGDGEIVAILPGWKRNADDVARDARMLSFAGKLHWALGNLSASVRFAAADLRFALQHEGLSLERRLELVGKVAAQLEKAELKERAAFDGALLSGTEARQFDQAWRQDDVRDDIDLLEDGDVVAFRARYPFMDEAQCRDLVLARNGQPRGEQLVIIARHKRVALGARQPDRWSLEQTELDPASIDALAVVEGFVREVAGSMGVEVTPVDVAGADGKSTRGFQVNGAFAVLQSRSVIGEAYTWQVREFTRGEATTRAADRFSDVMTFASSQLIALAPFKAKSDVAEIVIRSASRVYASQKNAALRHTGRADKQAVTSASSTELPQGGPIREVA